MTTPNDFLEIAYQKALSALGSAYQIQGHSKNTSLDLILQFSEQAKGVLTVVITSVVYKALNPTQDVRNHQTSIANGYSGRTFDSQYITPFMKDKRFPAMAESGWLTRSLEQKVPYDFNYTGAINPNELKVAFLSVLDELQNGVDATSYLDYLFQGLILKRNAQQIDLAKPTALTIHQILNLLELHFNAQYQAEGASRLPVLAIYAAYQALLPELKRFENMQLLPLESHTSSDTRSGRIGDIQINDGKRREFEAVEVKHGILVNLDMIKTAYKKFSTTPVDRYYILSTAGIVEKDLTEITNEIQKIKNLHGCQIIANGIMDTLKYYLRLLSNPYEFIEHYVNALESDKSLKFEHKQKWNELIGNL